jgi:hypothetical protein
MRGRLTVFVGALVATLVIGIGIAGSANVITRLDGNDTKGPLDLGGAKVSHVPGGSVFQINTLASFTNAQANGKNGLFEVGIDSNADRNPNYFIDVFFAAGRFRGVLFKPNGSVITYNLKAARVSPKAVKVTLPHSQIIQKGSYDFLIFSAYFAAPCTNKNPCVDAIPNRYPLIRHDFTPPSIKWGSAPAYASDVSTTLSVPLALTVTDDPFGSGVKNWILEKKPVGTLLWETVETGSSRTMSVNASGEEGSSYDFRVRAVDRQNNKGTSTTKRTSFPFDDRNVLFTYSAATQSDGVAGTVLATTSSLANDETITFTMPFSGATECFIGGPTAGAALTVYISRDGTPWGSFSENGTTPARHRFCTAGAPSGTVFSLRVVTASDPFVFDGFVIAPL